MSSTRREQALLKLDLGSSYLEAGRYPEALGLMLEAYELDPKNPVILNNLGLAYFYRGRLHTAIEYLEKAVKMDPQFTDAKNNLGRLLMEKGDLNRAEILLKEAVEDLVYPYPEKPLFNLGALYYQRKQWNLAQQTLEKVVQHHRSFCSAYLLLAKSYYNPGKYLEAATWADRAVGVCSHEEAAESLLLSGMSYRRLGDNSRSFARLKEMIQLYPNSIHRVLAEKEISELHRREKKGELR